MKHFVPLVVLFLVAGCASIDTPSVSEMANGASPAPAPTTSSSMATASTAPATPLVSPALALTLDDQPVALAGTLTVTRNDSLAQINVTSFGPMDHFKAGDRLLVVEVHPGWQSNASASATLYQMLDGRTAAFEWGSDQRSQIAVRQTADRVEGQIVASGSPRVQLMFVAPIVDPAPSPVCVPSPAVLGAASVSGRLFDQNGAPISSGTVEAVSTNTSDPYDATTALRDGVYQLNNVPLFISLRLVARASGYVPVYRYVTLTHDASVPGDPSHCGWQGPMVGNWIDFGGHEALDPLGASYPLTTPPPGLIVPTPLGPQDAPTSTPKPQ